jgi:hypothetical protein
MLCSACLGIFSGEQIVRDRSFRPSTWKYNLHHATVQGFLVAVATGCLVCYKIRRLVGEDRIKMYMDDIPTDAFSVWRAFTRDDHLRGYDLKFKLENEDLVLELLALP